MCLQYFARIRYSLLWTSDNKFNTLYWVQLYLVSLPWSEKSVLLLLTWIFPCAINHASHKSSFRHFFKNFPWGNYNEVSQLLDKTDKYLCNFMPPLKRSSEASLGESCSIVLTWLPPSGPHAHLEWCAWCPQNCWFLADSPVKFRHMQWETCLKAFLEMIKINWLL